MISKNQMYNNILSKITYNGSYKQLSKDKPNIYMGIGLWSSEKGLSQALPVDIMQMLVAGTVIINNPSYLVENRTRKIIIIIADHMALEENQIHKKASDSEIIKAKETYQNNIQMILLSLGIDKYTKIILTSDLKNQKEYKLIISSLEETEMMQNILKNDPKHYKYILSQTAITKYLNIHKNVGTKIGWIYQKSKDLIDKSLKYEALSWDELKFDTLLELICKDVTMTYIYVKAGIKVINEKNNQVSLGETCPYTSYEGEARILINSDNKLSSKNIKNRILEQWSWIPTFLQYLSPLLEESNSLANLINPTNEKQTICNVLNYWASKGLKKESEQISWRKNTINQNNNIEIL